MASAKPFVTKRRSRKHDIRRARARARQRRWDVIYVTAACVCLSVVVLYKHTRTHTLLVPQQTNLTTTSAEPIYVRLQRRKTTGRVRGGGGGGGGIRTKTMSTVHIIYLLREPVVSADGVKGPLPWSYTRVI